jgi:hypothetical protein
MSCADPTARSAPMAEVVHIAGVQVDIGGRYLRQRCSWCGAVLIDYDLAMMGFSVVPGEEPKRPAMWEVGVLVLVDGPMSTTVEHKDGDKLPPSSCVTVELDRRELEQLENQMEGE